MSEKAQEQAVTRLSRDLLQKQGSFVRVIGFETVFKETTTVAAPALPVGPLPVASLEVPVVSLDAHSTSSK